jgi:NAD(P)-dependent dehydrogenase (short-subunit alcohol dehydrogenase family)
VKTLVKHFAAAFGERGIRGNAVAPGVVPTEKSAFTKTQEGRDFTLGMQALKRLAMPEVIAATIASWRQTRRSGSLGIPCVSTVAQSYQRALIFLTVIQLSLAP